MNHRIILFLLLGLDVGMLLFQTAELSISYDEANILYGSLSFLQLITNTSLFLFGQNDLALRLPMIIFHLLSVITLYLISKEYISKARNRVWLTFVFILLPGVMSSAIILNSAGIVIFGLLFFIYSYKNYNPKFIYILLLIYLFIESDFLYLFIALLIYSLYYKNRLFFLFNLMLITVSIYLYGYDILGSPKGYFIDAIAVYAAIFSPIIFIYIFYILYRRLLIKEIDIIWFISFVVLMLSLLLSFRQRISIEDFAPYLIIALPLAAQTFYSSYRIRLRVFRGKYRAVFILSLVFLLINSFIVFFNKNLYAVIENPKNHFVYKMHIAKDLAHELRIMNINCVDSSLKMSYRLRFYGVNKCSSNKLEELSIPFEKKNDVSIRYMGNVVYAANVTKINNK